MNERERMNEAMPDAGRPEAQPLRLSRRFFIKSSGAGVASIATVGPLAHAAQAQEATPAAMPGMEMGSDTRPTKFFNIHEAETVDAIVSRLMPGDESDPGAHEAGVVFYIDSALSGTNIGYNLKTYTQGPFPVVSEEPTPVEASSTRDIYDYVSVPADLVARYGYQSTLGPQEIYRRGLGFVDAYSQTQYQLDFVGLSPDQQDQVLKDMEADTATGFEGPGGKAFFTTLRNDTIEGFFSDPMYGGNRNLVGWKLIGYPGPQRFYTPDDIKNPSFQRDPQSLATLMANEGH